MKRANNRNLMVMPTIALLLASNVTFAEVDVDVGGFIRADYGLGDRYGDASGDDTLGISKAALAVTAKHRKYEAVLVVGTENMTADDSADGDVTLKDAFIVWHKLGGSKLTLSVGAQPLMFGLKPSGYPGDHSLQGSIEFGGADGFAVSNQAGPAIILNYQMSKAVVMSFGAFDTSERKGAVGPTTDDGSSLAKNQFIQFKYQGDGLYGLAGFERRYVGAAIDDSESIVDVGVGIKKGMFDLSAEYIYIDQAFVGLADDENYLIVELVYNPNKRSSFMIDWSTASESDNSTVRLGYTYQIDKTLQFHAAYAMDDYDVGENKDSFDMRLTYSF